MKRARDATTGSMCFDVHGVQFTVPYTVLRASPPGILRDMFNDDLVPDETHVLDRDPCAFAAVMQALRHETVLVPHNSTRAEVLREFEFFFAEPQPRVWRPSAYELAVELKRVYPNLKANIIACAAEALVRHISVVDAASDGDEICTASMTNPQAMLKLWSNGNGGLGVMDIAFEVPMRAPEEESFMETLERDIGGDILMYYLSNWPFPLDMVDALNSIIGTERGYISSAHPGFDRVIRLETSDQESSGSSILPRIIEAVRAN